MNQINGLEPIQDDEAEQDERARNLGAFDMGDNGEEHLEWGERQCEFELHFVFSCLLFSGLTTSTEVLTEWDRIPCGMAASLVVPTAGFSTSVTG